MFVAVVELHSYDIYLKGDSLYAMSLISNQSITKKLEYPVLLDILHWKNCCRNFKTSHVYREANRAADFIAKKALQGDLYLNINDIIMFDDLNTILQEDRRGRVVKRRR